MPQPITPSAAEVAVGADDPARDWILRPETHANALAPGAGALRRILVSPEVTVIMARYTERDREAVNQQARYLRGHRYLRILAYAAAATGLFALSIHLILSFVPDWQPLLVALHVACLTGLVLVASWLNSADPRAKWLAARGEAEQLRVALFDRVLVVNETAGNGELPLLPLKLAYFRRYQLDVQLRYFKGRGKPLDRPVGISPWMTWPAQIIALIALAIGVAFLAHVADERGLPVPSSVLLLLRMESTEQIAQWIFPLLAFSSLYALVLSQQSVSAQDQSNARYLSIYRNLNYLKGEAYERVRENAEAGDNESVARFVRLIHALMLAEQSQWVSFQGLVENGDTLLAGRSATGLTELFNFAAPKAGDREQ